MSLESVGLMSGAVKLNNASDLIRTACDGDDLGLDKIQIGLTTIYVSKNSNEVHRTSGPAVVNDVMSVWVNHGQLDRVNGPAIEFASGDYAYYTNGQLHRKDGPAVKTAEGEEYHVFGRKVDRDSFEKGISQGKALYSNGIASGFLNSASHVFDLEGAPAAFTKNSAYWFADGRLHNPNGPAIEGVEDWKLGTSISPLADGTTPDGTYALHGVRFSKEQFDSLAAQLLSHKFENDTLSFVKAGSNILHREDGPAVYDIVNETSKYYCDGILHNKDGPAVVNHSDSSANEYWLHGFKITKEHFDEIKSENITTVYSPIYRELRIGTSLSSKIGPVFISETQIVWRHEKALHRDDGPALIKKSPNGITEEFYYIYNQNVSKEQYESWQSNKTNYIYSNHLLDLNREGKHFWRRLEGKELILRQAQNLSPRDKKILAISLADNSENFSADSTEYSVMSDESLDTEYRSALALESGKEVELAHVKDELTIAKNKLADICVNLDTANGDLDLNPNNVNIADEIHAVVFNHWNNHAVKVAFGDINSQEMTVYEKEIFDRIQQIRTDKISLNLSNLDLKDKIAALEVELKETRRQLLMKEAELATQKSVASINLAAQDWSHAENLKQTVETVKEEKDSSMFQAIAATMGAALVAAALTNNNKKQKISAAKETKKSEVVEYENH